MMKAQTGRLKRHRKHDITSTNIDMHVRPASGASITSVKRTESRHRGEMTLEPCVKGRRRELT